MMLGFSKMKKGDKFSRLALRQGYRSRAAIKLIEIQDKFSIAKENDDILDLGCAPGGCLQVLKNISKNGYVLGIDTRPMEEVEGALFINKDFREVEFERKFDTIFSDVGPIRPGITEIDMDAALELEKDAIQVMKRTLKPNGNFVMKIFQEERIKPLIEELKSSFQEVHLFKPESSRKNNKEIYIVCLKRQ